MLRERLTEKARRGLTVPLGSQQEVDDGPGLVDGSAYDLVTYDQ